MCRCRTHPQITTAPRLNRICPADLLRSLAVQPRTNPFVTSDKRQLRSKRKPLSESAQIRSSINCHQHNPSFTQWVLTAPLTLSPPWGKNTSSLSPLLRCSTWNSCSLRCSHVKECQSQIHSVDNFLNLVAWWHFLYVYFSWFNSECL